MGRLLLILSLLLPSWVHAQLTDPQLVTLRAAACADTGTARAYMTGGNPAALRAWFNASGAWVVWRTSVSNEEIGDAMNGTEVAGLSSLGMQRLQVLAAYSGGTQNPSRADRRAAFAAVFSGAGGQITRAALDVVWRRDATRAEKALSTGAGTQPSPATLTWEGLVGEVEAVRVVFKDDGSLWGC